jgi:hypothetical protein
MKEKVFCKSCSSPYFKRTPWQQYCSPACRSRAHRANVQKAVCGRPCSECGTAIDIYESEGRPYCATCLHITSSIGRNTRRLLRRRYRGRVLTVAVGHDPQWREALNEVLGLLEIDELAFCQVLGQHGFLAKTMALRDLGTAVLMHSPKASRFSSPILELEGSSPREYWDPTYIPWARHEGNCASGAPSAEEEYFASLETGAAS